MILYKKTKGAAAMENKLTTLIDLVKHLPEKCLDQAIESLEKIKGEAENEAEGETPDCPHCCGKNIVRNGKRRGNQRYLCRDCGKSFVRTTGAAVYRSHSGEAVWKQVIRDTVNGIPIDRTAANLGMGHETIFNMRHKVLFCLEQEKERTAAVLSGVLEADETYLLESLKGKPMPDGYWREARKHKAVSVKQGISDEYICVCAAVERGGNAYSLATGRGISCKEGILAAFLGKIRSDALMVCDGAKSYGVLEERNVCSTTVTGSGGFYKINEVNGYHSFIKERNRCARGFATKYLNRYNALFSRAFRGSALPADEIYKMPVDRGGHYRTIAATRTEALLSI
jgi:transposase-like protein